MSAHKPHWKIWRAGILAVFVIEASLQWLIFTNIAHAALFLFLIAASISGIVLGVVDIIVMIQRAANVSAAKYIALGSYAGTRDQQKRYIQAHPDRRDRTIPIHVFDLDITDAQGQNEREASISVQTVAGAVCSVDVIYEGSHRPATAYALDYTIKADRNGRCKWIWKPLQQQVYVGTTHVLVSAKVRKKWEEVKHDFEMYS